MKPATLGQIATIALLLLGRGIAREGDLAGVYHDLLAYTPDRCPVQLDASASVAASVSIAPDILTELKRSTKGPALDAYFIALGRVLTEDVAGSGMFARVQPPAGPAPDYAVQVQCEMFDLADFHLRISLQVLEPATRRIAVSKILMVPLGIAWGKARRGVPDIRAIPGHYPDLNGGTLRATINNTKFYMQQLMATLKAKAAEDLQYQRKLPAALESIRSARLPDLLVASDPLRRHRPRAQPGHRCGQESAAAGHPPRYEDR